MGTVQIIVGSMVGLGLAFALLRSYRRKQVQAESAAQFLFSDVENLLGECERHPGASSGSWTCTGQYAGHRFQFTTVADTLSTRKLPSLWLLLTLPKPQPLPCTIDVMLRPAGMSTFSNFDFLPNTLALPADFPPDAVVRSDRVSARLPLTAMAHALPILRARGGKELLLSPKGLRLVVQIAEADRLRYGVFREARFEDAKIAGDLAKSIMDTLLRIDQDLATTHV
jgi:hypothetical protein